ncbi:ABC transporter ATP-binding protein [Adonisia turfae]|uniref:ABC transporter ATP-binding protein n=1 Tax=Adonisia turfae CCMR0081 TaxID=2292702 RepID=A0A6M0RQC3_9CYAN|nr:ABC transporter ATP-binding protein [Adonisia turfae]NEZ58396.1 ABC transporter ATP-binding protein [Adonisia turfae CCMR0081]
MTNLVLQGISKYFGASQALNNIYLTVDDGEFVSLVGPSGCGKTTLLRIIAGLETVSEGDVMIAGQTVNELDPAQRNIAMVFQSYALYPHKSVFENIAFPLRMQAPWFTRIPIISHLFKARKTLEAHLQEQVPQTADLMHLGELLKRKPGQLSGGQRQRVALARAMVRSPQLFLMDEPLSNLDAKLRADMRAEIIELRRQLGGTFIYVTHDQSEAMTMSDRVVLMHEGSIQQIAAPSELYDNPANLFVAEFIGSPKINTLAVSSPTAGELYGFGNHLQGVPKHIDGVAVPVREALSLCLRPEALRLLPTQARDAFTGRIHILENLGNEFLVIVHPIGEVENSGGDTTKPMKLVARVAAMVGRQLHPGDTVHLQPDWSQALLFNQDGFRLHQATTAVLEEVSV